MNNEVPWAIGSPCTSSFVLHRFILFVVGLVLCVAVRGMSAGGGGFGSARAGHFSAQSQVRQFSVPGPSWPLFRGDAQATGVARDSLPEKLDLLWTFSADQGRIRVDRRDRRWRGLRRQHGRQALRPRSGDAARARWEFSTPLGFSASAAVRGGRVYVGDIDGEFHCLDAATGKQLWNFQTDGEIDSSANFHDDRRPVRLPGYLSLLSGRRLGQARLEISEPGPDPLLSDRGGQPGLRGRLRRASARDRPPPGQSGGGGENRLAHRMLAGRDGRDGVRRHRRTHLLRHRPAAGENPLAL